MHDSIGMMEPHSVFYLPDGSASGNPDEDDYIETYTLVQNPNEGEIEARVSYLTETGQGNVDFTDTIPANSRRTYAMESGLTDAGAAILVECLTPGRNIIAERAMYLSQRWCGTSTIGGYSD